LANPWQSIVWGSREELAEMADRVGWRVVETTPPAEAPGVNVGAVYGAVLRPEPLRLRSARPFRLRRVEGTGVPPDGLSS
jgi:hypothetical protein